MIKKILMLAIILILLPTANAKLDINNPNNIILDATIIIDDIPKYLHFENGIITESKSSDNFKPDYKVITTQENYNKMMNIYSSYQENNKLSFIQKTQIFKYALITPIFKYAYSDEITANTSHLPQQNMNFPAKIYVLFHT